MAENWVQGSFAFRCSLAEADLLEEAMRALMDIMMEDDAEPPDAAMAAIFPPTRAGEPWSGLVDLMPDPEFPGIHADWSSEVAPDDPNAAIIAFYSMEDFDPFALAELIRGCCRDTLAKGPIGFEWAATCSKPRIGEFGGGWCAVFADRIEADATGSAMSRALEMTREDFTQEVPIREE